MQRIPEPELMLDPDQARAYAEADFSEPHTQFVAQLLERVGPLPSQGRALDLGCGSGDVTLRVARALPGWRLLGLDASPAMLKLARAALGRAQLLHRVELRLAHLPLSQNPHPPFDLVYSNSLLHHLAAPETLWSTALEAALEAPTPTRVFVMDLLRPPTVQALDALVAQYVSNEPDVLQRDFRASLHAAYTPDEVALQLARAGIPLKVDVVTDRHWVVWGTLVPGSR